ncbi:MAG: hypothetical protein RR998_09950 [Oscillospiraceae bacterium]
MAVKKTAKQQIGYAAVKIWLFSVAKHKNAGSNANDKPVMTFLAAENGIQGASPNAGRGAYLCMRCQFRHPRGNAAQIGEGIAI